jgi:hypothetical protein
MRREDASRADLSNCAKCSTGKKHHADGYFPRLAGNVFIHLSAFLCGAKIQNCSKQQAARRDGSRTETTR